jgi:hypothetical protein
MFRANSELPAQLVHSEESMSTFCTTCGNSINTEDKFCRGSGAPASASANLPSIDASGLVTPVGVGNPPQTSGKAIASLVLGRPAAGMMLSATSIRVLCVLIVTFGVARNLPLHPFNMLAPGALLHL